MRKLFFFLIVALATASQGGAADNSALRSLITGDDSRGWEAVGRLEIDPGSFCTGALIAPDLVLTAGHCIFDQLTGEQVTAKRMRFLAGWRNGRASAYRGEHRAIVHPDYKTGDGDGEKRTRYDLALLELDQPIRSSTITPFDIGSHPRKGAQVGVVSYAHDRSERPSLQKLCHVLARQSGVLILSCDVDLGSSGSPVFVVEDGNVHVVSVISALAMVRNLKVSLGTSLEQPLALMRQELAKSDGVFKRVQPTVRSMSQQDAQRQTGAKFVRP